MKTIGATLLALIMMTSVSHAQRRNTILGLGLVATAIATVAAAQNRKAYATPSTRRTASRQTRSTYRKTASTGRSRAATYRSGGGGGGGGNGGYTYTPAPSNPNPHGLYGTQPAYAPCTRFTLNVDGSKHCF